uniref:Uncharacterized protein n=1 Tax=Arundo donax TaxID=35708 RepID=A0A0A9EVA7_ARUDO
MASNRINCSVITLSSGRFPDRTNLGTPKRGNLENSLSLWGGRKTKFHHFISQTKS